MTKNQTKQTVAVIKFSAGILLICLTAAFLLFGRSSGTQTTYEFSDGSKMSLLGVSHGTNEFVEGSWRSSGPQMLPDIGKKRFRVDAFWSAFSPRLQDHELVAIFSDVLPQTGLALARVDLAVVVDVET